MRNHYNILIGLALLFAIGACYLFPEKHYYSIRTGEEVPDTRFAGKREDDQFKFLLREETSLNYDAGITAGTVTLGVGFLLIGFTKRRNPA
jgi:hypothetical protein